MDRAWNLVFAAWLVVTAATLGALFMSEVMEVPTCVLCWWQRIFMFPLVLVLPMGLFPYDPRVVRFAAPLAAGGWLVALWHTLLLAGIVPERAAPCRQGVPCSEPQLAWLGFIDIPHLSLAAFTVLIALLLAAHHRSKA